MKPGGVVAFGKKRTTATIMAVTGSGASGYKTLTLDVDGKVKEDVPHIGDATGATYWDEHAVPDAAESVASAPVVPVKSAGRATAGVGSKRKRKR